MLCNMIVWNFDRVRNHICVKPLEAINNNIIINNTNTNNNN